MMFARVTNLNICVCFYNKGNMISSKHLSNMLNGLNGCRLLLGIKIPHFLNRFLYLKIRLYTLCKIIIIVNMSRSLFEKSKSLKVNSEQVIQGNLGLFNNVVFFISGCSVDNEVLPLR